MIAIIKKARARGVGAGIHCIMGEDGLDLELRWIDAGANFILHGADIIAATDALGKEFNILKSGHQKQSGQQQASSNPRNI